MQLPKPKLKIYLRATERNRTPNIHITEVMRYQLRHCGILCAPNFRNWNFITTKHYQPEILNCTSALIFLLRKVEYSKSIRIAHNQFSKLF